MSYSQAYNYVKNNNIQFEDINSVPRKIIIPKEAQYTTEYGTYFNYKNDNRIVLDNYRILSKNTLPTLKELSKICKLDSKNLNKQEIINQLENHIIFL